MTKKGAITGYRLKDFYDSIIEIDAKGLKETLGKIVDVVNLQLTSDNRIIDKKVSKKEIESLRIKTVGKIPKTPENMRCWKIVNSVLGAIGIKVKDEDWVDGYTNGISMQTSYHFDSKNYFIVLYNYGSDEVALLAEIDGYRYDGDEVDWYKLNKEGMKKLVTQILEWKKFLNIN